MASAGGSNGKHHTTMPTEGARENWVIPNGKTDNVFWRPDDLHPLNIANAVDISEDGDGGLFKRVKTNGPPASGDGDDVPSTDYEVDVHYIGTLEDGSIFDSSRDRPGTFSFVLGTGRVIRGLDVGVATMRRGEVAEFYMRCDYGWGQLGIPPTIPKGATLKFEVELLALRRPTKPTKEDAANKVLPPSEMIRACKEAKAAGTEHFKASKWDRALSQYEAAARCLGEGPPDSQAFPEEDERQEAEALLVACQLNRAQCLLKMQEWHAAAAACTKVLDTQPDSLKALFRRGTARTHTSDYAGARDDLRRACALSPNDKEVRAALAALREAEARGRETERSLYAKMVKGTPTSPPGDVAMPEVSTDNDGDAWRRYNM